jgi:hypothetical protein
MTDGLLPQSGFPNREFSAQRHLAAAKREKRAVNG